MIEPRTRRRKRLGPTWLVALALAVGAPEALAQPVTINGIVIDETGQPLPRVSINANDPTVGRNTEFFTGTRSDGTFQLSVPPAAYVVSADPLAPYQAAAVRVDARSGSVSGIVIQVGKHPALYVPDVPPRAALIQISAPNGVGDVTVTGAPGAVPPESTVFLVNLETRHITATQAGADGSFAGSVSGPRGTSIQVRADPLGVSFGQVFNGEFRPGGIGALGAMPATILRAPDPPPPVSGVAFASANFTRSAPSGSSPLPLWTVEGTISGSTLAPGSTLTVTATIRVVSAALASAGAMRVHVRLSLDRLSGPDGTSTLTRASFASTILTPTGLPIERFPRFFNQGLDRFMNTDLPKVAPDRAEVSLVLSLPIPSDLPAGYFRPLLNVNFENVPGEPLPPPSRWMAADERANRAGTNAAFLPIVRVGSPAAPRLPWTLLSDTLSNGTRGTTAIEDRSRFGVASRIVTQSETFIVPRLDPASGQPLTYRLEPFAPTVSVGNEGPPNAPLIPFDFPSGSLTVRIQKPDGSIQVIGPAPFVQSRMKSLASFDGQMLDSGGGHITDLYELSTLHPAYDVQFTQDGRHVITLDGSVRDIWGNTWTGGGTYEVFVARTLSLDTAVLPGTMFEVGDVFNAGLVVSPPAPVDVEVRIRVAPNSDPARMIERVVRGRANRFGYFHPIDASVLLSQPGEYRVDVVASFVDGDGKLWMGSRTWGGVVARHDPPVIAHGRRGIDNQPDVGNQWFFRTDTGLAVSSGHVPFPFHSGDVMWHQESDSAVPLISLQDKAGPAGPTATLLRQRGPADTPFDNVPHWGGASLAERWPVGEMPLFSSRADLIDPYIDPSRVDLWGYSYRSVQRPLVRVREEIGEDGAASPYWRFRGRYGNQIGTGRLSDQPNDIKFQYGAAVLRGSALTQPLYAIHGSLFVLVPDNDPLGGTRTFPPFRGNPTGPAAGGPIMTLKGQAIDLFVHLTGVRPGNVLEVGDVFALSGAIGPTLPSIVFSSVTKPDGVRLDFSGRANGVGYYYHPEHNLLVDQAGVWTVDVTVVHDGVTSAGQVTTPFPSGNVLGTSGGRFSVYVVPRGSPLLAVDLPRSAFLTPPATMDVVGGLPAGVNPERVQITAMMPGFVLESRDLPLGSGRFSYRYDPVALNRDFPNLDVSWFGHAEAADLITLSLFAEGRAADGTRTYAGRVLALHGPELLNPGVETRAPGNPLVAAVLPASRSVRVGATATAFATVINTAPFTATGVGVAPAWPLSAGFTFQRTNAMTNEPIGAPGQVADIPPGGLQTFVFAISPTAPLPPADTPLVFVGNNVPAAEPRPGLNTLLLSAAPTAVPDVVALAATASNDGVVRISGVGSSSAFAVATVNVGSDGIITAVPDTGGTPLPLALAICRTDPSTGACLEPALPSITTQIGAGATPTFAIFAASVGPIAFDPAAHRIFVRFRDAGGLTRGATSVAIATE